MSTQAKPTDATDVLTLESAADKFINDKEGANTVRTYRTGVDHFLRWCGEHRLSDTGDLTPAVVGDFNTWVRNKVPDDWKPRTAQTYSGAAREFVHHCEKIGATPYGTHDLVDRYDVTEREKKAELAITPERLDEILGWYKEHKPHTRETVILWVLRDTGMRANVGLQGVDIGDLGVKDGTPFIHVVDRPEDGHPTKKHAHQRKVPIREELYEEIREYVEHNRVPCEEHSDAYGTRRPLLTSQYHGTGRRASKKTIQAAVYMATCPEETGITANVGDCGCSGPPTRKTASACEHSVSPHKLRGATVVRMKDAGFDYEDMEPYLGATADVLRSTYDRSGEDRDMERSAGLLDAL